MLLKRNTLILLVALAAIIAYYFAVEESSRKEKERKRLEAKKLFLYEGKDLAKFIFINPQNERIEAEQGQIGDWKITYPVLAPADNREIESFISQIVPGRGGEEIGTVENLADYGLEPPFATLILVRRDTSTVPDTLFVGAKTPTSYNSYVRLGSHGPVRISSDITHNVMNRTLYHFRNKVFFSFDENSVSKLSIKPERGREIRLRKEGKHWWFEDRPARADRLTVESYLTSLSDALIREFASENLNEKERFGISPSKNRLSITRGNETTNIYFGSKKEDKVYATREGLGKIVLLEEKLLQPFDWTAEKLRAMNLAFFDIDSVASIHYETPDTSASFERSGTKWIADKADSTEIKSYEVNALLRKLESTKFDRIISEKLSESGSKGGSRKLQITLKNKDGSVVDSITILDMPDSSERGMSTTANCTGELPRGTFDSIRSIFLRVRDKK